MQGETGIQALAISAAPYGCCRQFLCELSTAQQLAILLSPSSDHFTESNSMPLTTYLRDAFGSGDLGAQGGLMNPKLSRHKLSLDSGRSKDPMAAPTEGQESDD